jgi:hypothetical protein
VDTRPVSKVTIYQTIPHILFHPVA